jgi:DNA-directed RNA polymerase subunit RPC12/RpoP
MKGLPFERRILALRGLRVGVGVGGRRRVLRPRQATRRGVWPPGEPEVDYLYRGRLYPALQGRDSTGILHALGFAKRQPRTYWVCRCGYTNPGEFLDCWQCRLPKVSSANVPAEIVFKCLGCGSQFSRPASGWLRYSRCPECGHHYFNRMVLLRCGHFGRYSGQCEVCTKAAPRRDSGPRTEARSK